MAVKLAFGYARHAAVIVQIAERHQLVKVFKSRQIADENYHVVGLQRQRIGVGAYFRNQPAKILDAEFFELFKHLEVDKSQHLGVINGAVMIEVAKPEIFCNCVELMHLEVGIDITRKRNCVKVWIVEFHPLLVSGVTDKSGVKIGVVRDKQI